MDVNRKSPRNVEPAWKTGLRAPGICAGRQGRGSGGTCAGGAGAGSPEGDLPKRNVEELKNRFKAPTDSAEDPFFRMPMGMDGVVLGGSGLPIGSRRTGSRRRRQSEDGTAPFQAAPRPPLRLFLTKGVSLSFRFASEPEEPARVRAGCAAEALDHSSGCSQLRRARYSRQASSVEKRSSRSMSQPSPSRAVERRA